MLLSQRIKKMANAASNAAEKRIGNVATQAAEAKNFVFSMARRTVTPVSTTFTKTNTISYPGNDSSLMANTLLWAYLIPPMPIIESTMYRHYAKGDTKYYSPPAKSWSLSTDITIAFIRDFLNRSSKITVEDIQKISTTKKLPIPSGIKRRKFTIPNEYRKQAGDTLVKLLTKKDEAHVGWEWEKDRETAPVIKGEWLQSKGNPLDPCKESTVIYLHGGAYCLGCYSMYRQLLGILVKYSKGRTCAILQKTMNYTHWSQKDDELHPIDPKKIVIAGDSAGGGLTFALLLAIRDTGLPTPGGVMILSPWMDLTHSLPSALLNIMTDYLPATGFKHAPSPALDYAQVPTSEEDEELPTKAQTEAKTELNGNLTVPQGDDDIAACRSSIGPFGKCVPVPSINGTDIHRVQFYADNNALKIPMGLVPSLIESI